MTDYPGTRSGRHIVYDYAERVGHLRPEEPPEDSDEWPEPREVTREGVMARLAALERDLRHLRRDLDLGDTPRADRPSTGVSGGSA